MVALKKEKKFAEEQFEKSNSHAYWQGVIKEIDIAIEYVKDTL